VAEIEKSWQSYTCFSADCMKKKKKKKKKQKGMYNNNYFCLAKFSFNLI